MNVQEVIYGCPQAAYLILFLLPLAWLFSRLWSYRQGQIAPFAGLQLVRARLTSRFVSKALLFCGAWILATIALMQPMSVGEYLPQKGGESRVSAQHPPHQVLLLLDASASMAIPDGANGKTRLVQSQEIADAFIQLLQGEWLSLQAFTSEVTLLVPPTTDYLFAREKLRQIQVNEGGIAGTSFEQLLAALRDQLLASPFRVKKTVMILSDGGDTHLESLVEEARTRALQQMVAPWPALAHENQLKIYTVGVGSEQGGTVPGVTFEGHPVHSALNRSILQQVSAAGAGQYVAADSQSASDLAALLMQQLHATEVFQQRQGVVASGDLVHSLYFQFPLGVALLLLAIIWMLPDTVTKELYE